MARAKVEEGKKFIRKDISMDPEQYERLLLFCQREERSISGKHWTVIWMCNGTQDFTKLKFAWKFAEINRR